MISTKAVIYVFLITSFFETRMRRRTKKRKKKEKKKKKKRKGSWLNSSHIIVKGHERVFTLREVQKRTCRGLNSLPSQPKRFLTGHGHCHKARFNFRSIACHLASKSKSIFMIPNVQDGKTSHTARSWTSFRF